MFSLTSFSCFLHSSLANKGIIYSLLALANTIVCKENEWSQFERSSFFFFILKQKLDVFQCFHYLSNLVLLNNTIKYQPQMTMVKFFVEIIRRCTKIDFPINRAASLLLSLNSSVASRPNVRFARFYQVFLAPQIFLVCWIV